MLKTTDRIFVTGGTGLIGTNLTYRLRSLGYEVLSVGSEQDLRDQSVTKKLFSEFKPTVVYHLAAKVGGIFANSNYKADFYSDNVLINTHVVNACASHKVRYVFAMGTGCAYPKRLESEVLYERDFLDGVPEVTNDAYAYAKRGLLVHLQALAESTEVQYLYCLPANIYGPYDNYHPKHSHVVPGLIRRFCDAVDQNEPVVSIWGDGSARRDFLYIDDCIDAMMLLAEREAQGVFNVSTNVLTSVRDLAHEVCSASGFRGDVIYDTTQPAGQMQRIFDSSKMVDLGWQPKISFTDGIGKTVNWFRENRTKVRER
ncbi:MAG: NAD-dependent epimerase/dehydratase family protein [Deltaproteobacteria bacterium]|nr:NAD-dependent epimerase/dehydratase family protein [Deltaproteobacteria bacterium]